ncbi:hypothetical protein ACFLRT_05950 [Acidobacteriota bacterium]
MSVNTAEWLFREEESLRHSVFSGAETVRLAMTEEQGLETFALQRQPGGNFHRGFAGKNRQMGKAAIAPGR